MPWAGWANWTGYFAKSPGFSRRPPFLDVDRPDLGAVLLVELRAQVGEGRELDSALVAAVPIATSPVVGEGLGDHDRTLVPQVQHHVPCAAIEPFPLLLAARDRYVRPGSVGRRQDP